MQCLPQFNSITELNVFIMSLLETAKMNGLNPHACLTDILQQLPGWTEEHLDTLRPLPGFIFVGEGA